LQEEEAANHRGLRRLRAGVVSVAEKSRANCVTSGLWEPLSRREGLEALEERFSGLVAIVVAEFKPGSPPRD
jgi:hypothetical protein